MASFFGIHRDLNIDSVEDELRTIRQDRRSAVGWVDAIPTQHLLRNYVGLRKDATQPT